MLEHELDVRIPEGAFFGSAVHRFLPAWLDIDDECGDAGGPGHAPARAVIAGSQHGGERYGRIDVAVVRRCDAVLEPVELAAPLMLRIAFQSAAAVDLRWPGWKWRAIDEHANARRVHPTLES